MTDITADAFTGLLNLMSNDSRPNGNDGDNNPECLVFVAMLNLMLDGFVLAFSFEVGRSLTVQQNIV